VILIVWKRASLPTSFVREPDFPVIEADFVVIVQWLCKQGFCKRRWQAATRDSYSENLVARDGSIIDVSERSCLKQ
jgi:hypothetical protein